MEYRLKSVSRTLSLNATVFAFIVTVAIPAGYFLISYRCLMKNVGSHAEFSASNVECLFTATNPGNWQSKKLQLQQMLEHYLNPSVPEQYTLLDKNKNVIAQTIGIPAKPIVVLRSVIHNAGIISGYIELESSLRPLIIQTAWLAAAALLIGILTFISIRTLPLKAIQVEIHNMQKIESQNRQFLKSESLRCMAGSIAHLFNNQLQTVTGNIELLMNDFSQDTDAIIPLSEAMQAARKAAEISGMMLTFRGQPPGKMLHIDLSNICRQSLSLIQGRAPDKVSFKTDFPDSGPIVIANDGQLQQALMNIATNGWEAATEKESTIHMTVKTFQHLDLPTLNRFPVDWRPTSNMYACIEITDTGCGISPENMEKLFDPFYTTKFIGRGMGLPVVLGIIRAHHGAISVDSRVGRGSTFRMFIPEKNEKAIPSRKIEKKPIESIVENGTVLLVDDEPILQDLTAAMLAHLGYTVLVAKDGIEAIQIFKKHQASILFVLSDLTMPRMDGWRTLEALRIISPGIPVILTNGYDEAHMITAEHFEQPDAFLEKPYRYQELKDTIQRIFSVKPSR